MSDQKYADSRAVAAQGQRIRRSPEQAKDHILHIAEEQFDSAGLEGLKLTDIAANAGISHGTILHHFGSRDGLHNALMQRLVTRLVEGIINSIRETGEKQQSHDRTRSLRTLYDSLATPQHASLIHWLVSGQGSGDRIAALSGQLTILFDQLAEQMLSTFPAEDAEDQDLALREIRFYIKMAATAAIGTGLAGRVVKPALGLKGDSDHADYLSWLAALAPGG